MAPAQRPAAHSLRQALLWLPDPSGLFVYKKTLAGITPWNPFSGTYNPEVWYYTRSSS